MGKTYQSTTVNAPADQVWNTIRNFHDMSWASSIITKCVPVGDLGPDQVGAKRILNDAFHETLHELNAVDHSVRCSIDDGPSPLNEVTEYVGLLRVSPVTDTDTSYVEWSSTGGGKDQETAEFCSPLYVAMLADLKSRFK
jgi:hypothetical protein